MFVYKFGLWFHYVHLFSHMFVYFAYFFSFLFVYYIMFVYYHGQNNVPFKAAHGCPMDLKIICNWNWATAGALWTGALWAASLGPFSCSNWSVSLEKVQKSSFPLCSFIILGKFPYVPLFFQGRMPPCSFIRFIPTCSFILYHQNSTMFFYLILIFMFVY